MKCLSPRFFCLLVLATGTFSFAYAQQEFKTTSQSVIGYLEYLPPGYHASNASYPVVIFLHGRGEKGPNSRDRNVLARGASELMKLGPPKHVKKGTKFPFILISPQLKSGYGDWPSWYVMEVVEHVKRYLRIDESRIYLTGLSLGGGGVWTTAQDYPDVFAAIAPVCGSRNSTAKAPALVETRLPVWAFHGDRDNVIPLGRSVNMVDAINRHGADPRAKMSVYRGVKHDAWDNAYRPDHGVHRPNVYDWMLAQRNQPGNGKPAENRSPVANAGRDVATDDEKLVLRGSARDDDGKIVAYQWRKVSGPDVAMEGTTRKDLVLSGLRTGVYVFSLTVTDDRGGVHADDVTVRVSRDDEDDDDDAANTAPVADAGKDFKVTLPATTVKVTGRASDADGKIKSYTWRKIAGGDVSMKHANTAVLHVSGMKTGRYTFRLEVTDNRGARHADDVNVTVESKPAALAVNAGPDRSLQSPADRVTLKGKASGSIRRYSWSQVKGGRTTLRNAGTPVLDVMGLRAGTFIYRLTVEDESGTRRSDDVMVTVYKKKRRKVEVFAGADKTLTIPVASLRLSGTAKSSMGKIVSWHWNQNAGKKVTISNPARRDLVISNVSSGGRRAFRLVVRDSEGNIGMDHVRINFKNAPKARRASSDSAEVVIDAPIASLETESGYQGGDSWPDEDGASGPFGAVALENARVIIFNDRGERIFAGPWEDDSFSSVFRRRGLYIYHVVQQNGRIASGKIYFDQ